MDLSGFSSALTVSFTGANNGQLSTISTTQAVNTTYKFDVTYNQQPIIINFIEGATSYRTSIFFDPVTPSSYAQIVTSHRATLTIDLVGYNPSNTGDQLPSMVPNSWAVKLTTGNGANFSVFREYYTGSGSFANCTSSGILPLSSLTGNAVQPFAKTFNVTVLPWFDIKVRVLEKLNPTCPSTAGPFVDCHYTASDLVGQRYRNNCTSGSCHSGLCVTQLQIPSLCDWDATVNLYNGPRYGIQNGTRLNLTMSYNPTPANLQIAESYRFVPSLPWGRKWTTWVLAVNNIVGDARFPSGASAPTRVAPRVAGCADGQSCEFLALGSLARIDVGNNSASVVLTQGGVTIGNTVTVTGVNYFCVLNEELNATATYDGGVQVTRTGACATVNQFCNLPAFYVWVTPNWDCWANPGSLDVNNSYPTNGLSFFVYYNTLDRITFPGANANPLGFRPVPLSSGQLTFQVPDVSDGQLWLRLQEGDCNGPNLPLTGCQPYDSLLVRTTGATAQQSNNFTTTDTLGRILTIFDLFYLPENVTVDFLKDIEGTIFRRSTFQGGAPRCYCVLPVQLKARITEQGACFKSETINCMALYRPGEVDDCELCDFNSILRVDLRGLPALTTDLTLRVGPSSATTTLLYSANSTFGNLTNFRWVAGAGGDTFVPATTTLRYAAGSPNASYTVPSISIVQQTNPLRNGFAFDFTVPAQTSSVRVRFASSLYQNVIPVFNLGGQIRVAGSVSGVVLASRQIVPGSAGQFTADETPDLNVQPGEVLTISFFSNGNTIQATPLLSDISIVGLTYSTSVVRTVRQVGNAYQNITVLRSCHCDTPQAYWLTVTDNTQAAREQRTECCNKICTFPDRFTRLLCLNLADSNYTQSLNCTFGQHPYPAGQRVYGVSPQSPVPTPIDRDHWNPTVPVDSWYSTPYDGCGYSIFQRVIVDLYTVNGVNSFRTIARQGGRDGCAVQAACSLYSSPQCPNSTAYFPLGTRSTGKRAEFFISSVPSFFDTYYNGNSYYTVLALPYRVRLSEYNLTKTVSADCSPSQTPGFRCSPTVPLVSTLSVDTNCEGYNNEPQFAPVPHAGDAIQWYANASQPNEYPGIGFDITLFDQNGVQFRGKRSKLYLPNCTFDRWAWSSATCLDCGYRFNWFTVLAVPQLSAQLNEVPYQDRPAEYPDSRITPRKRLTVNCQSSQYCEASKLQLFSRINVKSARGAPSATVNGQWPFMFIKFGNVNQIALRMQHESYVFTNGTNNAICVVADDRAEYAVNWGITWASNNAGNFFADCSSVTTTQIDNCRNPNSPSITGGSNNGLNGGSAGYGNPAGGNFIVVPPAKRSDVPHAVDMSVTEAMQRFERIQKK